MQNFSLIHVHLVMDVTLQVAHVASSKDYPPRKFKSCAKMPPKRERSSQIGRKSLLNANRILKIAKTTKAFPPRKPTNS
jgi:hypothetical protein